MKDHVPDHTRRAVWFLWVLCALLYANWIVMVARFQPNVMVMDQWVDPRGDEPGRPLRQHLDRDPAAGGNPARASTEDEDVRLARTPRRVDSSAVPLARPV